MFIDLGNFKPVNDCMATTPVICCWGRSDSACQPVPRRRLGGPPGGDEFIVALAADASPEADAALARKVLDSLSAP
jgi:predicted signal transduction protein with EAL and GGDEF domain